MLVRSGDWAWCVVGVGVLTYDVVCPKQELLSEACDRYLTARPVLTHAVVLYVAAHLLNLMPQRLDPLHRLSTLFGR